MTSTQVSKILITTLSIFVIGACKTESTIYKETGSENKYANRFSIDHKENFKIIRTYFGEPYHYVLANDKNLIPDSLKKWPFIQTPITKAISLSSTHIGYFGEIESINSLVGIGSKKFIHNVLLKKQIQEGHTQAVGYDQNLNFELIYQIKPDVIFLYSIANKATDHIKKLQDLGIQTVIVNEYLEEHPLAKAEWVKFFAAFVDKDTLAQSNFKAIEKAYLEIKNRVQHQTQKPNVLVEIPWKGSWYIPGGDSYMYKLIEDAGGKYLWNHVHKTGSFPIDLEVILNQPDTFDIWINCSSAKSLAEVEAIEPRLTSIRAFKEKHVYNWVKRLNEYGGNDYWESGVVNPHRILQDLFHIFHADSVQIDSLYYYAKLN